MRSNGQATFTLPSTGIYTIRVSAANRRSIGWYNLNLECFFPAPSPDAVVLPCGALASGTIGAAGEVDLFSFSGEAGQIISLTVASTGGFTPRASNGSVALTLFAPSGAILGGMLRSNGQGIFTLSVTGPYVVRVNAANLGAVGSYNVNMECLFPAASPDAVALSCGTTAPGTIVAAGEVDVFTFSGQAGQVTTLALTTTGGFARNQSNTSASLTLFAPSGSVVQSLRSNSQAAVTLPVTGSYVVGVAATNLLTTGSYGVQRMCP